MSRGKKAEQWQINDVIANAEYFTARQLAERTGLSENWIYQYCNFNAIKLLKVSKKGHIHRKADPLPEHKRSIVYRPDPPKKKIVRPPAVYSNVRSLYGLF